MVDQTAIAVQSTVSKNVKKGETSAVQIEATVNESDLLLSMKEELLNTIVKELSRIHRPRFTKDNSKQ